MTTDPTPALNGIATAATPARVTVSAVYSYAYYRRRAVFD